MNSTRGERRSGKTDGIDPRVIKTHTLPRQTAASIHRGCRSRPALIRRIERRSEERRLREAGRREESRKERAAAWLQADRIRQAKAKKRVPEGKKKVEKAVRLHPAVRSLRLKDMEINLRYKNRKTGQWVTQTAEDALRSKVLRANGRPKGPLTIAEKHFIRTFASRPVAVVEKKYTKRGGSVNRPYLSKDDPLVGTEVDRHHPSYRKWFMQRRIKEEKVEGTGDWFFVPGPNWWPGYEKDGVRIRRYKAGRKHFVPLELRSILTPMPPPPRPKVDPVVEKKLERESVYLIDANGRKRMPARPGFPG